MPELSGKLSLDGSQYNKTMSDAEKENARFQRQVNNANKELNNFTRGVGSARSSLAGLAQSFKAGDIGGFITNARGAATAITSLVPAGASASTALTSLGAAATTALGPIGLIAAGIAALIGVSVASIGAVEDFDKSMRSLSALTGVTGSALDEMGDTALEMSDKYGIAATEIVGSMEKIGSQAPVLLQDKDAMAEVTEAAIVLQKAAGNISMDESSAAITTVMNQMGVAASEATGIINALAAGSQKGAADINYLNQAIAKSGAQAAGAGMSYQQLVGAVETIAPKFASAEVAGTALNTLLVRLQTQSESKFNPAIVGMEKALDNLAAANLSAEDKVKLFGQSALLAGNTLIQARKEYQQMTDAVTGTNTAYDQMNTRTGGLATTFDKLKNTWNNFMIVIGQSAPIQAIIGLLNLLGKALTFVVQAASKVMGGINTMVEVVIALFGKLWDNVKPLWDSLVNAITNSAIYQACAKIFKAIYDTAIKVIRGISDAWHSFLQWLGVESKKPATKEVKINVDTSELNKIDEATKGTTTTTKTGGKKAIEFDKGSLEYYKHELQDLEKRLTSKKLSPVDVEKTKKEIENIKGIIEQKEIELGVRAKPGSLEYIEGQISEVDSKLRKLDPKIDQATILDLQIKKDALVQAKKDVEAAITGPTIIGKEFKTNGESGSLQEAQDRVSYYTQLISVETQGTERYDDLVGRIKEWTAKEHEIKLKMETDLSAIPEGTQEWLNKRITQLKAEIAIIPTDTAEYDKKVKELKELTSKKQVIDAKINMDTSLAKDGSLEKIQQQISEIKSKIKLEVYGSDEYNELKQELTELENEEHTIKVNMEIDDMGFLDVKDEFVGMIDDVDGIVGAFENLTDVIESDANGWEIFMASVSAVNATIDGVSNTIKSLNTILKVLGITQKATTAQETAAATQSSANAATQVAASSSVVAAKTGESIAGAAASGAKYPWPLNLVAIAASLAMVLGVLAMIGSFADGGIISGRTTIGDMNLARVNAGEMILNQRQQNNLFEAIDQDRLGGGGSEGLVGDVVIRGSEMHLLLKNYGKEMNSVGKDIGIR